MRKLLISLIFFCIGALFPNGLEAQNTAPRCMRDVLADFFDPTTVTQAMSLYQVPQGQWILVTNAIKREAPKIYRLVQKNARKKRPNPMKRPYNPEGTLALMKETLFSVFEKVMQQNYIKDQARIERMFQYIQSKKIASIEACFKVPLTDPYLEEEPEEAKE